jgi:LmbE family N-acetylglucosaminyl deacetylase
VSGARLLKDFTCTVDIRDALETKRAALERYASQMRRLVPDPAWRTLGDVSNGDFLQCFLQEREVFKRYLLAPSA